MSNSPRNRDELLTSVSHRSMACDFVVLLPPHEKNQVEAVLDALETLDRIESWLTVYQVSSDVSKINRSAAYEPVEIRGETFRLIEQSIKLSRQTLGAFDITAGPLVRAWGFLNREGRKPTRSEIDQAKRLVGCNKLHLNIPHKTVAFDVEGMEINLGAIGKGYAIDLLADQLHQKGVHDFLIHGGQSSVLAQGRAHPEEENGWLVGLSHPTKPKRRLLGIWLKDQALGTSGSGKQFFHHRGKRYGHVIDPRTGYPAGDLLSLTIVCDTATKADSLATGLFVLGQKESVRLNQQWGTSGANDSEITQQGSGPKQESQQTVTKQVESTGRYGLVMVAAGNRQDEVVIQTDGPIHLNQSETT